MAGEIANAAARNTVVAGNIGVPVLDALEDIEAKGVLPDVFVLELSSFQLESTSTLNADAATVLNLSEDHLDRYAGMKDYAEAKARVFHGKGVQVLNREDPITMKMALPGREVRTFGLDEPRGDKEWGVVMRDGRQCLARGGETLVPVDELAVTGMHNAANALAALALTDAIWLPNSPAIEALRRFRGLPHRVEHIADIGGISFYDDSKGTNVGATVAALKGMPKRVVLIAGGDGKGQNFTPLAEPVRANARAVVLIGRDAELVGASLAETGVPLIRAGDMQDAVDTAYRAAREGDAVLLSPACASYDMFRSYVHRAEVFVQAVKALAQQEEATARG
jgi:UDP-N-acetylmuramoylalanine--D-glutamate ligase